MTLNELKPGDKCRIIRLRSKGQLGHRLMDLGFFRGVDVCVVRNAPLVDPVEVTLGNFQVSLRHEEAGQVEVEPL